MPSQVQEAFGRVIVEAGHRGIPAVASRIGGIPEAIGDSGVLVDPDDSPEHWAGAIDGALTDRHRYARLRAAALANAAREEFDAGGVARRLLEILHEQAIRANVGVQVVDR
jgi:D-inositol-3-phosphate glycosyltransferase